MGKLVKCVGKGLLLILGFFDWFDSKFQKYVINILL